jgi:hypothetical protein
VSPQLFDHPQPEDRFFAGMVQNMQPNEPRVEVLVTIIGDAEMMCHRLGPLYISRRLKYRSTISKSAIKRKSARDRKPTRKS